jgi:hypothetical protein
MRHGPQTLRVHNAARRNHSARIGTVVLCKCVLCAPSKPELCGTPCRCDHGAFSDVVNEKSDVAARNIDEDLSPGLHHSSLVTDAQDDTPPPRTRLVKFSDSALKVDAHLQIETPQLCSGDWDDAVVVTKTTRHITVRWLGRAAHEPAEKISKKDFDNRRECNARVLIDSPPDVRAEARTSPQASGDAPTPSTTFAAAFPSLKYDPATHSVDGLKLGSTLQEQSDSNLKRVRADITEDIGPEYVWDCGDSVVIGEGAISQRVLAEVSGETSEGDLDSISRDPWQTGLPIGLYVLAVGSEGVAITVKHTSGETMATASKLTNQFGCSEDQEHCHFVSVQQADWTAYSQSDSPNVAACIEADTNNAFPLMVCICDISPDIRCPRSTINTEQIPAVMRSGMSESMAAGKAWSLEKLPLLRGVVNEYIEQQCEYYASAKWDVSDVTGETVYTALHTECGEHWMEKKFAMDDTHDRAAVEAILETAITKWLRQLFPKDNGKPSGKMKKTLLADLKKKRQASDDAIPLCQGQNVHARWTTVTGTLDAAVNAQNPLGAAVGFAGAIIRRARDAGYWAVRFDVDGKVHNFIPRKYIVPKHEPAEVSSE